MERIRNPPCGRASGTFDSNGAPGSARSVSAASRIPLCRSRWLGGRVVGKRESAEHESVRKALATWVTTQGLPNVKTPADPTADLVPDVPADYVAKIVYGAVKLSEYFAEP